MMNFYFDTGSAIFDDIELKNKIEQSEILNDVVFENFGENTAVEFESGTIISGSVSVNMFGDEQEEELHNLFLDVLQEGEIICKYESTENFWGCKITTNGKFDIEKIELVKEVEKVVKIPTKYLAKEELLKLKQELNEDLQKIEELLKEK